MTSPDVCLPQGRRDWPDALTVGMLGIDEVRVYERPRTCRRVYVTRGYDNCPHVGEARCVCSECGWTLRLPPCGYRHCPGCGALIETEAG